MAIRWVKRNCRRPRKRWVGRAWTSSSFPKDAVAHFRQAIGQGAEAQNEWKKKLEAYQQAFPAGGGGVRADHQRASCQRTGRADLPKWKPTDKPLATRAAGGEAMNALAKHIPNIDWRIGGSESVDEHCVEGRWAIFSLRSSRVRARSGAVGGVWGYAGRNVAFGVREHAMGAAVNGMAAHGGVLPFSATFLVFSDYMKPSIRLGALSRLKVFYVFTHDSIGCGRGWSNARAGGADCRLARDSGLSVIRPADANETVEAWSVAIQHDGPTLFALTRQHVPHLDRARREGRAWRKGLTYCPMRKAASRM